MQLDIDRLRNQLMIEEGLRLMPYDDATGFPVSKGKPVRGNLTIGIGRNLDGNPLTTKECDAIGHNGRSEPITYMQAIMLLDHDIASCCCALDDNIPWWKHLDEVRARVLVDLCFNMGIAKLLGFKKFLSSLRLGAYEQAAAELKNSLWYFCSFIRIAWCA